MESLLEHLKNLLLFLKMYLNFNLKLDAEIEAIVNPSSMVSGTKQELSTILDNIKPLSGFSDWIYVEVLFDPQKGSGQELALEFLVVNQTPNKLSNVQLELSTLGDLSLIEKPMHLPILEPNAFINLNATVKIRSTELAVIMGTLAFELQPTEIEFIILEQISIDMMKYILPSYCTESQVSDINFFSLEKCGRNLNGKIK